MSRINRKRKNNARRRRQLCRRCSRRPAVRGGNVCNACARALLNDAFAGMTQEQIAAAVSSVGSKGGMALIERGYAKEHEAEIRALGGRPLHEVVKTEDVKVAEAPPAGCCYSCGASVDGNICLDCALQALREDGADAEAMNELASAVTDNGDALEVFVSRCGRPIRIGCGPVGLCGLCSERPRVDGSPSCFECFLELAQRAFAGMAEDEVEAILEAGGGRVEFAVNLADPFGGPIGWVDPATGLPCFAPEA